jgi:hypothetical protein
LKESGSEKNIEAANYLEKCNTSSGTTRFDDVVLAKSEKKGSLVYEMLKNPRGICIIVNNFVKIVKTIEGTEIIDETAPHTIPYESIRFKKVFEQLHFDVRLKYNLNITQIRELLISSKKEENLAKSNAFVFMIVTHGENEQILGFDGTDCMNISKIVDMFSETNCPNLQNKPKLFFFNCCRISNDSFEELALFSNLFYFSYRK